MHQLQIILDFPLSWFVWLGCLPRAELHCQYSVIHLTSLAASIKLELKIFKLLHQTKNLSLPGAEFLNLIWYSSGELFSKEEYQKMHFMTMNSSSFLRLKFCSQRFQTSAAFNRFGSLFWHRSQSNYLPSWNQNQQAWKAPGHRRPPLRTRELRASASGCAEAPRRRLASCKP